MDTLTKRATVHELVAAFQAAEAQVRANFAALVQAEESVNVAFGFDDRRIRISASSHWTSRFEDADDTIERMARDAWEAIVDRLELRRAMSIARYEQLETRMRNEKPLPVTEENVAAFVRQYAADLPTLFDEAVREVFEWLRPRGSKYKSNSEYEIPRRIVVTRMVDPVDKRWAPGPFRVHHYTAQKLIALENVFHGLGGEGTIAKDHYAEIHRAIEATPRNVGAGKTDLFAFRVFANGNAHLTFLREDLLARLNQIAGGKRLKPAA